MTLFEDFKERQKKTFQKLMNLAAHTAAAAAALLFPKSKTWLQRLHCAGKQWYGYIQVV